MENSYQISEISHKDFDSVKDIIYESKLIDEKLLTLENAVLFIKDKLSRNKAKIFATKHKDTPVAFIVLYYKVSTVSKIKYNWHISYLYVKPDFRRKYIGKEIMMKCIDYAKKTKVDHISLNTSTDNFAAHQLYENFGFVQTNFISNYYYYEMKIIK
ncbi:GNAT family N-acetyltransferase [Flavobacterium branchiarum]|uniref:GNAT family N-acetyltransferase n=1 Tax=Flavobacterium branchiarum TaxID=1114870 RepID=A0ABV5FIP8_9FLAO|nr:GNAT family N-acetyltransferase [Flavobacterium branchiarum]MDN3675096.1 GNAT family N-acetyltransferase [Flavobacterium branchiarum]